VQKGNLLTFWYGRFTKAICRLAASGCLCPPQRRSKNEYAKHHHHLDQQTKIRPQSPQYPRLFGRASIAILLRLQESLLFVFGCFHRYTSNSLTRSLFDARVLWVKWLTGKKQNRGSSVVTAWIWSRHRMPFASIRTDGDEVSGGI
jgi:hypothetical protein